MCGFLWHFLGSPPSISYMVMCPCALSDGAFGALFETLVAAQVPRGKHLVARSSSAVRPGLKERSASGASVVVQATQNPGIV